MRTIYALGLAAALAMPLASANAGTKDIVGTAEEAGTFTTLLKAATAAGLLDKLKGEGPYTIFAPTDAAFAEIDQGLMALLMMPENKDELAALLKHHIVPGKVLAVDVRNTKGWKQLTTARGATIGVAASEGDIKIGDAKVVKADIVASNGIVHVIDQVIDPSL
ncbi:MAG: fasciclin domain-containing protein [Hyphomicrobiaceae bacterium]